MAAIKNTAALNALNALASGGTAGMDAYKAAQAQEATSRTTALQGALGGNGVANAAQAAQAQYAPAVGGLAGASASNLLPAADSYLSQASAKLGNQAYEDQQQMAFEQDKLRRQQGTFNQADRLNMLQGAADQAGEAQRAQAQSDVEGAYGTAGVQNALATRQSAQNTVNNLNATLRNLEAQAHENPGNMQIAEAYAAAEAQRNQAQQQVDSTNEPLKAQLGTFAKAAGTDTKGFDTALAGNDINRINELVKYLNPQAQENANANLDARNRGIDVGDMARMRELAPKYGFTPQEAAGRFRDVESKGAKEGAARAGLESYVGGVPTAAERKAQDEHAADTLGFDNAKDFTGLRTRTGMTTGQIASIMQTPDGQPTADWSEIQNLANQYIIGAQGGGDTGAEGFKKAMRDKAAGLVNPDGTPASDTQKAALANLAITYFAPAVNRSVGKGKLAEVDADGNPVAP